VRFVIPCLLALALTAPVRADLLSARLAPSDDPAAVARAAGAARWLAIGERLIVDGATRPRALDARDPRTLPHDPRAAELRLVLTKHPWSELGAVLERSVLHRHAGVGLAAIPHGARASHPDHLVEIRAVAWNRVLVHAPSPPALKGEGDPTIDAMVGEVSAEAVRADIQKLVDFKTRHSLSAGFKAAAEWAEQQMTAAGLSAKRVPFTMAGRASENVVGEVTGDPAVTDLYLVGGHLDSINGGESMTAAPGADDNASGSACVLAIARVFARHRPRATIRFVLFGGEEQGLLGSRAYLASLTAEERARLKGVLILDMTAFHRTPQKGLMLEGREVSGPLFDAVAMAAARYAKDLKVERTLQAWGSDHIPFLDEDIPALLTFELDYPENGNQHGPRDTMQIVDAEQAAAIARADVAALAALAGMSR
jgi:hypothetical protein